MDSQKILDAYQGRGRDALLPILWDFQQAEGYISAEAVHAISHTLRVPEADIYGVIAFYSLFHAEPTAETQILVCTSPICGIAGSRALREGLCQRLGVNEDEITADGRFSVGQTTCLGLCEHAPAAFVIQRGAGENAYAPVMEIETLLNGDPPAPPPPRNYSEMAILLSGYEATLADYGDYAMLRDALHNILPREFVAKVEAATLVGRGGAAFPTALKWSFAARETATPKYVIANADESEPGTFKDRVLMETRPHLLLEGMALTAYAIGAESGYLFIRGEYPHATERMQTAIQEARAAGLLGQNIMGMGFNFDIEIRRGAGAYICGEETALFEAIEGKRGFPRIKPPFPTTEGLFNKPTVINNVETLCAVVSLAQYGVDWFKAWGTEKSSGLKLFCVSGHVAQPGLYELAPGVTLRELLMQHCGGVIGELQAVLMGGAAGTFLTPDQLDVKLSFEDLRAAGSTLGSGAVMVFNTTVDLRDVLRRLAYFFQHESCGKCFPCQLGTQRQLELLEHPPQAGDSARLQDIGLTMTEASLCGLGQTAGMAVLSAMQKFPELF